MSVLIPTTVTKYTLSKISIFEYKEGGTRLFAENLGVLRLFAIEKWKTPTNPVGLLSALQIPLTYMMGMVIINWRIEVACKGQTIPKSLEKVIKP